MRSLISALVISSFSLNALEPEDIDYVTSSSLPPAVWETLLKHWDELSPYALSAHINPFYLRGDLNGDGNLDTAILIIERTTGKAGVLIVDGAGDQIEVLGAGQLIGSGRDDFSWVDAWYVYPKGAVDKGADQTTPPQLISDGLMLIKTESASGLIFWTGTEFQWYQQGD